jgi:hypothetical protein
MPRKRDISVGKGTSWFSADLNQVLDRVYKKYPNSVSPTSSHGGDLRKIHKRRKEDAAQLAEKLDELRMLREKSEELATLRESLRDLRDQVKATRELREQLGLLRSELKP